MEKRPEIYPQVDRRLQSCQGQRAHLGNVSVMGLKAWCS